MRRERKKPEVTDSAADVEVSVSKGDQGVLAGYKVRCKKKSLHGHAHAENKYSDKKL